MDIPNYMYYDSMPFCAPHFTPWLQVEVVYLEEREAGGGELGDDGDTSNIGKEEAVARPEQSCILCFCMHATMLVITTVH